MLILYRNYECMYMSVRAHLCTAAASLTTLCPPASPDTWVTTKQRPVKQLICICRPTQISPMRSTGCFCVDLSDLPGKNAKAHAATHALQGLWPVFRPWTQVVQRN